MIEAQISIIYTQGFILGVLTGVVITFIGIALGKYLHNLKGENKNGK